MYLLASTIFRFENSGQPMIENNMDLAVLESFLVFIAFSNVKTRRSATDFKLSELFKIMLAMWTTHDDEKKGEDNDNRIDG